MTIRPRTVDNLGIEASVRYAKDKELFEAQFIEDAHLISQRTAIPVAKPYIPSEFDQLFNVGKTTLWASFSPPPDYFGYARPLFSHQLIPSLGGYEKQEDDTDKLAALEGAIERERKKRKKKDPLERESDEEEDERKAIAALLACVEKLDKVLMLINTRRNQYQRG